LTGKEVRVLDFAEELVCHIDLLVMNFDCLQLCSTMLDRFHILCIRDGGTGQADQAATGPIIISKSKE